jgi:tetratricopeptide (TPR) repeat protein
VKELIASAMVLAAFRQVRMQACGYPAMVKLLGVRWTGFAVQALFARRQSDIVSSSRRRTAVNRALTVRKVAGAAFVLVNLSVMSTAVAQDRSWKECELAEHDPERSIEACSRLLSRPSTRVHAAAFHNRGLAWASKENLDQAVSDISQGIRLDPQRAYRWQERGEIYTRQGKYSQAITDITEAIRLDPTPRAFRFHSRAGAYRGLGDLTRAIADFDEAIRLDPVARPFRFHDRGNALSDAGQYDRALVDYETAAKLAPTERMGSPEPRTYLRKERTVRRRKERF